MTVLILRMSVALLIFGAGLVSLAQNAGHYLPGDGQLVYIESRTNTLFLLDVPRGWLSPLTAQGGMAAWSPDGRYLAFAAQRLSSAEIDIFSLADGTQFQLTDNHTHDGSPAWSPDGSRIAFVSGRDVDYDIYLMNPDGSNLFNLTNNHDFDNSPSWSPDGRFIAFSSNRSGSGVIYIMDTTQPELPAIPVTDGNGWAANPAWSPDGTRIVFEHNLNNARSDIYVINVDGTGLRNLTNYPDGDDLSPAWSPDSRYVAFISARRYWRQVYVIDTLTDITVPLTTSDSDKADPAWQP